MVDYKGILQVLESWELVSYLEKKEHQQQHIHFS